VKRASARGRSRSRAAMQQPAVAFHTPLSNAALRGIGDNIQRVQGFVEEQPIDR